MPAGASLGLDRQNYFGNRNTDGSLVNEFSQFAAHHATQLRNARVLLFMYIGNGYRQAQFTRLEGKIVVRTLVRYS